MLSDNVLKKFVETFDIDDWEVETDKGWSDIKEIGKEQQIFVDFIRNCERGLST